MRRLPGDGALLFQIQTATWRDLKEVQYIERTCFEQDAWPMLDLLAVLTFPSTVRIKAVVDEKMVGFIAGDLNLREKVGWITTIGVLPEHRNRGIATALLAACEQEMDMPKVRLCVRVSNITAQSLYEHLGYQKVETWKKYYSGKEDAFVFEKSVDS